MTKTGTQNRFYDHATRLMVKATFTWQELQTDMGEGTYTPRDEELIFDWNDRTEVRNFAAQSDRIIRMGGKTTLESLEEPS